MHIPDLSWEPIGDDRYGGQATVSQCIYKGRRVAVKVPYLNLINLDNILKVSIPPARALRRFKQVNCRDSAGRRLRGDTSSIRTSCR